MAGSEEGEPVYAADRLEVDSVWAVLHRTATWSTADARHRLRLRRSARGAWTDRNGVRPDLSDCIDVDVAWTPLTNALPIRRLGLAVGESRAISVVYVGVPDLTVQRVEQRYTCLAADRWRYEGFPSGYMADLTVDRDGLGTDYPGVFRMAATSGGAAE